MNLKNRQQVLTIATIALAAVFAGDKLLLTPMTKAWKENSAQIAKLRGSIEQGKKLLEREDSVRSRWEAMRTNTLPSSASAAEGKVFSAFEKWSRDTRITVTSIKPQWKHNNDEYMTLECRVDAAGNMDTLTRFLYSIEKDPMALKIDGLEIASRDNEGQQLTLGLQVSGLLLNPTEAQ